MQPYYQQSKLGSTAHISYSQKLCIQGINGATNDVWLAGCCVSLTHLLRISQIGSFRQAGAKIK